MKPKYSVFVIVSLLLVLAIEAAYIFLAPKLFHHYYNSQVIAEYLKKEYDLNTKIDGLKLSTAADFSATLYIEAINITSGKDEKLLEAKKIRVKAFLPALLFKKLDFRAVQTSSFILNLKRDKSGHFRLGEMLLDNKNQPQMDFKINNARIDINKYDVSFKDEYMKQSFRLSGDNFEINKFVQDKEFDFNLNGILKTDQNQTDFNLKVKAKLPLVKNAGAQDFIMSGYVNGLEPEIFLKYCQKYLDKDVRAINGKLNLALDTESDKKHKKEIFVKVLAEDFAVIKPQRIDGIHTFGKTELEGRVSITKDALSINDGVLKGKDYKVLMNGFFEDYTKRNPKYEINIDIPYARTESVAWILPSNLPDRDMIKKFKKYGLYADAKGFLKIFGNLKSKADHHIFGELKGKNVYITSKINDYKKTTLNVFFKDDTLRVKAMVVAKDAQWVDVDGIVKIFDPKLYADFKIKSSPSVELSSTQKILMPIHDTFQFELGPLPIMELSKGRGNIDLWAKGNEDTGEAYGAFNFYGATARFFGLNTKLENSNGKLGFLGKNITFDTYTGFIEGSKASVNGVADITGNLDFDVLVSDARLPSLIKIVQTSEMLIEQKELVKPIKDPQGKCDFRLKLKGKVLDLYDFNLAQSLNPTGSIMLKNASIKVDGGFEPVKELNGLVKYSNDGVTLDLKGKIVSSNISISGALQDKVANLQIDLKNMNLVDGIKFGLEPKKFSKDFEHINGILDAKILYKTKNFNAAPNLNDVSLDAGFKPQKNNKNTGLKVLSGNIQFKNGVVSIDKLNARAFNSDVFINGKINNALSQKPDYNLTLKSNDLDLSVLEKLKIYEIVPKNVKEVIASNKDYSGLCDLNFSIAKNKLKGSLKSEEIRFINKATGIPVKMNDAEFFLDDNKIKMEHLNVKLDETPLFLNAQISNIDKIPAVSGYFTIKLTDNFVNKYINAHLSYPIRIKGEAILNSDLSGTLKNMRLKSNLKINEDSDIFYMGANLGDESDLRIIRADILASNSGKEFKINSFDYQKYVTSQNNRKYPLTIININGFIAKNPYKKNEYYVKDINVKTKMPAPARLFNVLFKKSILKEGNFNSDINIKGDGKTFKMLGNVGFKNLDMPLYDTTVEDIYLTLNHDFVTVNSNAKAYDSDIVVTGKIRNEIELPIKISDLKLYSKKIDVDKMLNTMSDISLNRYNKTLVNPSNTKGFVDVKDFEIQDAQAMADDITIKGLVAKNCRAKINLKDSILSFDDLSFDITQGKAKGSIKYNFNNDEIAIVIAGKNVDANSIANSLFNAKDQIFGRLDGELRMMTKGVNEDERMKHLTGLAYFEINEGKMPKLGSLEYLLKAGNLLKSGITGFTMNAVADLVIPIKTGYFSTIKGNLVVKNGIAENVQIYSKGDKLSIYVAGKYNLLTENADMNIVGKLSKKINTILGPAGNLSLNTVFNLMPGLNLDEVEKARIVKELNKIPGLDLNEQDYRLFKVKIDGNINGDNYVTSFKWVE